VGNILVFNYILPDPPFLNGNTLRVFFLSRELNRKHRVFLVALGRESPTFQKLMQSGIYSNISVISPPAGPRSLVRHFHFLTGDQTRIALPKEYQRISKTLTRLADDWKIDLILTHTSGLAEYVRSDSALPRVMDAIDCNTLAIERKWRHERDQLGMIEDFKIRLSLARKRHLERELTSVFDLVTVVSPVDRDYLRSLCTKGEDRVIDIPNGVNPRFLRSETRERQEIPRSIAFWGSLNFPPNTTAIHYFYDEVFYPYLRNGGIVWYIIGENPSRKMKEMAAKHENIKLTGFVEDLPSLVSRIPLVVNPMRIGGGLKNKVIEAFALERVVVSNSLGMEAISSARAGREYVQAETPREFSEAIIEYSEDEKARKRIGSAARALIEEQYTWSKVGSRYLGLIDELLHGEVRRQTRAHGS